MPPILFALVSFCNLATNKKALAKLRAQTSKKNNFNEKKIERHIAYIDNKPVSSTENDKQSWSTFSELSNASGIFTTSRPNKEWQGLLADAGLIFTAFNLRRIFNIIDQNMLKKFLKELGFIFYILRNQFKAFYHTFFFKNGIHLLNNSLFLMPEIRVICVVLRKN